MPDGAPLILVKTCRNRYNQKRDISGTVDCFLSPLLRENTSEQKWYPLLAVLRYLRMECFSSKRIPADNICTPQYVIGSYYPFLNSYSRKSTNPNPAPIGAGFGFATCGGDCWTRTSDLLRVKLCCAEKALLRKDFSVFYAQFQRKTEA